MPHQKLVTLKIYILLLYLDFHPIIPKLKPIGQTTVGFLMETYLMGNMGEICLLGTDAARNLDSVCHQLMTMVGLVEAQGIYNQHLHSPQILIFPATIVFMSVM